MARKRNRHIERLKAIVVSVAYRLYSLTFRYDYQFSKELKKDIFRKNRKKGEGMLLAFWHQDELALVPTFARSKVIIMVSISGDGGLMDFVLRFFGYETVRGSSSKGGHAGFIAAYKKVLKGGKFAMAVDGPRGPIHQAKEGMSALSKKSGIPILPVHAYPMNYKRMERSWNKGRFPKPFTKILVKAGKPGIYTTEELTDALNALRID